MIIKGNNPIEMCLGIIYNFHINDVLTLIKPKRMLHIFSIIRFSHANLNQYLSLLFPKMVNNLIVKHLWSRDGKYPSQLRHFVLQVIMIYYMSHIDSRERANFVKGHGVRIESKQWMEQQLATFQQ